MPIEPTPAELNEGPVTLEEGVQGEDVPVCFTTRDVELGIASEFSIEDKLYAEAAINIAIDYKIFSDVPAGRPVWAKLARPATNEQLARFQELEKLVQAVTKDRLIPDKRSAIEVSIAGGDTILSDDTSLETTDNIHADWPHMKGLNSEQKQAHDIVINQLEACLSGRFPQQLLMIVRGQGGTGKSTLLNAITTSFDRLDVSQLLKKTAMSEWPPV